MICEFCNKELSSLCALKHHQKTTKYCIKKQQEFSSKVTVYIEEKCYFCSKVFSTKNNLISHLKTKCGTDIYKINKTLLEYLNTTQLLEKENTVLKNDNKLLTRMNEIYETDHKCVQDIAKQPKNITNNTSNSNNNSNNTLNITPIDFNDVSKLKNTIEEKYNMNYMFLGQKGISKFAYDFVLKDDEGTLNYVCIDASIFGFKYKDEAGEIRKDNEAKKLTSYLIKGGIKNKACNMASEWWKDDNGDTNPGKFELMIHKAESMRLLEEDNSEFKKELAAITSV